MLRTEVRVRLVASAESSRAQFMGSLSELTCTYALASSDADGEGGIPAFCLELSPPIAFAAIEYLLGGSPSDSPMPDRPLTAAERSVLHRLADAAAMGLSAAWPAGGDAEYHAPLELALSPAGPADQRVVVLTFELTIGWRVGTMRLCAYAEGMAGAMPPAPAERVPAGPLELSAALEGIPVDRRDLAGLAEGDIIATDVPADGEVIVRISGIPKFAARLGMSNGRKALTITRRLDGPRSA
jgi:flagellar motor switch protein FliM